jgi:mono/diheme cytochrome c family protein
MRFVLAAFVCLAPFVCLGAVAALAQDQAPTPPPANQSAVERGAYLFDVGDCASCHTDKKNNGEALAGGRALTTPFGIFYGPNITPDPKDGIGQWSEADFHRALRDGKGLHGENLFPVFPYPSFSGMSDEDIGALYAYIRAQKPVAQPDKPHEVKFPFGQRFLLGFWRMLYFSPGPLQPVAGQNAEWNRGRYLSEAVAHCQECHTPRNFLGGLKTGRAYAGNPDGPDGQKAPDITSDPDTGIGKWSLGDIETVLESGQTPDGDFVASGMGEVVDGTGKLTVADRHAVAVYIKSLPPLRATGK